MNKIELRKIYKSYGKESVIEDMDLGIQDGSFTVLLGPSGCGKSTILRMIAGLEKETGGEIYINGRNMQEVEPGDREIAMVFQNYALYPTMNVKENIEFGLKNLKIPKKEREQRIQEIAEMVGLEDYMHKKPQFLSGGQRQRVALARAMVKKPQVFLMDEPLSNLDAKLRSQIRTELIELHRRLGTTFVYVTHDQVEAMSMGTEIVLLEKGKIQQMATPRQIYLEPENVFTARFIGTPPMNVVKAAEIEDERIPLTGFIGFRPEHAGIIERGERSLKDCLVLEGSLVTHEMLGSEVLYKVDTKVGKVNIKLFEDRQIPYGSVQIYVPFHKLHFFDDIGNRVHHEQAQSIDSREEKAC